MSDSSAETRRGQPGENLRRPTLREMTIWSSVVCPRSVGRTTLKVSSAKSIELVPSMTSSSSIFPTPPPPPPPAAPGRRPAPPGPPCVLVCVRYWRWILAAAAFCAVRLFPTVVLALCPRQLACTTVAAACSCSRDHRVRPGIKHRHVRLSKTTVSRVPPFSVGTTALARMVPDPLCLW